MSKLLEKAVEQAYKLPEDLQDELGEQLLEDIESELAWQETLAKPQPDLARLAERALQRSKEGKIKKMGFDEL